jgi:hypothetical protein
MVAKPHLYSRLAESVLRRKSCSHTLEIPARLIRETDVEKPIVQTPAPIIITYLLVLIPNISGCIAPL